MADILELDNTVTIVNKSTTDAFVGKYAPRKYFRIEPGKQRGVPREYANMWFGDPDIQDAEERYLRLSQLRVNYGIIDPSADALFPKVEIYDFDSGDRLYMLFEDPHGEKAVAASVGETGGQLELSPEVAALRAELADVRGTLKLLVEQLQRSQGITPAGVQVQGDADGNPINTIEHGVDGPPAPVAPVDPNALVEPPEPDEPIDPFEVEIAEHAAVEAAIAAAAAVNDPTVEPTVDQGAGAAIDDTPAASPATTDSPPRVRG